MGQQTMAMGQLLVFIKKNVLEGGHILSAFVQQW